MRYASRQALLDDADRELAALCALLDSIPRSRWREPGVWGDGWDVHDLVAHLGAWHRLFLDWYEAGLRGEIPAVPAPGYKLKDLPRLNRKLREDLKHRPTEVALRELRSGHAALMEVARTSSEATLFRPGAFAWTKKNGLVTYLAPNLGSHYRFAIKVLRRWLRGVTVEGAIAGRVHRAGQPGDAR